MWPTRQLGAFLPAALLVVTGCATKDFVKQTVERERVEVNHRIDRVEGRAGEGSQRLRSVEAKASDQAQRFEAVGARVGPLETSVGQATAAPERARERQQRDESGRQRHDANRRSGWRAHEPLGQT